MTAYLIVGEKIHRVLVCDTCRAQLPDVVILAAVAVPWPDGAAKHFCVPHADQSRRELKKVGLVFKETEIYGQAVQMSGAHLGAGQKRDVA